MSEGPKHIVAKVKALAAGGIINPLRINAWLEKDGEPVAVPGRQIEIQYRRADGRKRRPKG